MLLLGLVNYSWQMGSVFGFCSNLAVVIDCLSYVTGFMSGEILSPIPGTPFANALVNIVKF